MPNINRFIRVNQNTPLTCVFMSGFEFNDSARDKGASSSSYATDTANPHQNSGYGGLRALSLSSGGNYVTLGFPTLREFVMCSAVYIANAASLYLMDASESSGSIQLRTRIDSTTGALSFMRSTGTTLGTSAGGAVSLNAWNWLHVWGYIDNSNGFAHGRIGSYANNILSVTGVDTQQNASFSYTNQARFQTAGVGHQSDDFMIFARSMYYTNASALFTVGETVTGGTSGATLAVTHEFDSSGDGCLFVRTVSGTFQVGETLTGGTSGTTATASNALGNNESSLWVREQYIFLATTDSDVLTGWTNSTGAAHYTEVDDPIDTADYVSTNTADQVDEYGTTVTLPPGADIEAVCVSAYSRLNGVSATNNIRVGLDDGAADVDSDTDSALSGSWEVHDLICTRNPNTGDRYTTTEIGNLNIRIISKT
jgi:hypothetical protein